MRKKGDKKYHTENPLLGPNAQNLVVRATWSPASLHSGLNGYMVWYRCKAWATILRNHEKKKLPKKKSMWT